LLGFVENIHSLFNGETLLFLIRRSLYEAKSLLKGILRENVSTLTPRLIVGFGMKDATLRDEAMTIAFRKHEDSIHNYSPLEV
jgi:hypothetical protein